MPKTSKKETKRTTPYSRIMQATTAATTAATNAARAYTKNVQHRNDVRLRGEPVLERRQNSNLDTSDVLTILTDVAFITSLILMVIRK